jgi:putative holliday junction resolvase
MSKILALDIGDQWTGIALSDALGIVARPYKTVATETLKPFLSEIIKSERLDTIVIGYPKTMQGKESEQTKKVVAYKQELEKLFSAITFILWDERLSSKRAQAIGSRKTQEEKLKSHSLAAAFILDSYLQYRGS